jgi:hypothetical protein
MKIRSLLLGTAAAAGLSTGAFATDLGVETGLDVCNELGLTGLTISSDDNCLQISGSVKFEFIFGDYSDYSLLSNFDVVNDYPNYNVPVGDGTWDHESSYDAWLKFVATANSSFGPASAVIKLDLDGLLAGPATGTGGGWAGDNPISQLYVTIGEGTVITAGKADSLFKNGNDEPLNFLGLFNSGAVDAGVIDLDDSNVSAGGSVLQVATSMDNIWLGAGLEDISGSGTLVGTVAYNTDEIKAHASLAVSDVLVNAGFTDWAFHAGFEGTFDTVKIVAAYGANSTHVTGPTPTTNNQNALVSASVDAGGFTIAASGEWTSWDFGGTVTNEYGYGASIATEVSDGITAKLGYRHFENDDNAPADTLDQIAGQLVAAVSDEVTLTGEIGGIMNGANSANGPQTIYYASGKVEWNPGGNFKASAKAEVNGGAAGTLPGFKITTDVEKSF